MMFLRGVLEKSAGTVVTWVVCSQSRVKNIPVTGGRPEVDHKPSSGLQQ